MFLASGLTQPPGGKVYQLWFNDNGTMRSAVLMKRPAANDAALMAGPVDVAPGLGITVEPAGGSDRPASQPLALMDFPGTPQ